MGELAEFDGPDGRRLAYRRTEGAGPGIVFLGGFMSDMEGTKAVDLERRAVAAGRAFLRFDYSGHGSSSGTFEAGSIGDWAADAAAVIEALTEGPQVLVGSSMGGWISLLLAKRIPARIAGLVGIAAAPDFTEDSMWAGFDAETRARLMREGRVVLPSEYSPEGYPITRRLIEDGRDQLVLRDPLALNFPVRLVHGTADADVKMSVPLRILEHASGGDIRLCFVKGADHRFSEPEQLDLIWAMVCEVSARAGQEG